MLSFWRTAKRNRKIAHVTHKSIVKRLVRLLSILCLVIGVHTLLIFYFENMPIEDALWLSFTSITTVGYGDISPETLEGRLTTILLIYVIGIWVLAQLAGDFLDYRANKHERMIKGLWRWTDMHDHILIINTPSSNADRYLIRLIQQIKDTPKLEKLPIEIVTRSYPDGLPDILRQTGVVHCHTDLSSRIDLNGLTINKASFVVVLAKDENDSRSDSLTLDLLDRMGQLEMKGCIVAECVLDENRERFHRLGASAVIRPVRGYPELLVRSMSSPGTERVLENLFTHQGASTRRVDLSLSNKLWADVVCKLVSNGLGTPLGFVSDVGEVITNPNHDAFISCEALLVMVNDKIQVSADKMRYALQQ